MNLKKISVLKAIEKNNIISQRELANKIGISLGSVNNIINYLNENEYILKTIINNKAKYEVLYKGYEEIKNSYVKTAVILAAGLGSRLYDITNNKIHKSFLYVFNDTLIERSIKILLKNNIEKIIIVTGHLSDSFEGLKEKYPMIETIRNEKFENTGSMASLAIAADLIDDKDFLLLESDLIYEKRAIEYLQETDKKNCILLSGKTNSGDEVYVEIKNNSIYKMSKDTHSLKNIYGELVGISKISKDLLHNMIEEYKKSTNSQYHYEYAIEDVCERYIVEYKKIDDLIWGEIDDSNHLKRINNKIIPKLKDKNEI